MKNYLVVIWDTNLSLIPVTSSLLSEINKDPELAFDYAQDAELTFPSEVVVECCEHIKGFSSLKSGHLIELTSTLESLLVELITPVPSC